MPIGSVPKPKSTFNPIQTATNNKKRGSRSVANNGIAASANLSYLVVNGNTISDVNVVSSSSVGLLIGGTSTVAVVTGNNMVDMGAGGNSVAPLTRIRQPRGAFDTRIRQPRGAGGNRVAPFTRIR